MNGHFDVVHFFIEQRCDPNIYDSAGRSVLHSAIEVNHYEIAKTLLSRGATLFPNGKYEKKRDNQSDTNDEIYLSKAQVKCTKKDPILSCKSMDDKMLLLLLNHINIDEYTTEDSLNDADHDIILERINRIINAYLKYQSLALFDILTEINLDPDDSTYFYCRVIDAKLDNLVLLMLDKKLPFNSTSELAEALIKLNNPSILNTFLDSGLRLTKENNPKVFKEVISLFIQHQCSNLVNILIEREIIAGDCTDIYYELLASRYVPFQIAQQLLDKVIPFPQQT